MEVVTKNKLDLTINRVKEELFDYVNQELQFRLNNPTATGHKKTPHQIADFYYLLQTRFKKDASPEEKATLLFLKMEENRLRAKDSPSVWKRLWSGDFATRLKHIVAGDYELYKNHLSEISQYQDNKINDHVVSDLKRQAKQYGFNRDIGDAVKKELQFGQPTFSIRYYDSDIPDTAFTLHFEKVQESPLYILNSFDAIAQAKTETLANTLDEPIAHRFNVNDPVKFTAREAGNLVNRRAVNKTGNDWLILDISRLGESFPFKNKLFDVLKAIEELPFASQLHQKGIYDKLTEKLASGDLAEINITTSAGKKKFFLQADPDSEDVQVFDAQKQYVNKEALKEENIQEKQQQANQMMNMSGNKQSQQVDVNQQESVTRYWGGYHSPTQGGSPNTQTARLYKPAH